MISLDAYPVPSPNVVGRIIDAKPGGTTEAVIVLPSMGQVKVVNEIGAKIWSLADGTRTVREIASLICKQYDVESGIAQVDTLEFIDQLITRGILEISENPKGAVGTS